MSLSPEEVPTAVLTRESLLGVLRRASSERPGIVESTAASSMLLVGMEAGKGERMNSPPNKEYELPSGAVVPSSLELPGVASNPFDCRLSPITPTLVIRPPAPSGQFETRSVLFNCAPGAAKAAGSKGADQPEPVPQKILCVEGSVVPHAIRGLDEDWEGTGLSGGLADFLGRLLRSSSCLRFSSSCFCCSSFSFLCFSFCVFLEVTCTNSA